jgi:DNA-directed RNA polymerase subunit RPC12/RpoP
VEVICSDCGVEFELHRRNEFEHRRRGLPHRCRRCRHPQSSPSPAAVARARAWWLERYSLAELRSWPPL